MKDVTAAIIIRDGRVLITRRAAGQAHAGWWEFPGGKIEAGESPEECLRRELKEELGIDTHIGSQLAESIYEYETGSIRLLAYEVTILEGEIRLTVHEEALWASLSDLSSFMLLPADRPIAEAISGRI
jgi:8-oxo-dGTP diphosphatase